MTLYICYFFAALHLILSLLFLLFLFFIVFFFNDTATTEIYTLSLHDALPIFARCDANQTFCVFASEGGGGIVLGERHHLPWSSLWLVGMTRVKFYLPMHQADLTHRRLAPAPGPPRRLAESGAPPGRCRPRPRAPVRSRR